VLDLADSPRFAEALGSSPRPGEVAALADLLVACRREEISEDQLAIRVDGIRDEQLAAWFSALRGTAFGERAERARRLTALRIAAAVYDGMPRHFATDTAESLTGWLGQPVAAASGGSARTTPTVRTTPRLADPDDDLVLDASRLVVESGRVRFEGGTSVRAQMLRFDDPHMPVALLRHAWDRHMWLRPPVIAWLAELGRHERKPVRVRAAQATGLLCTADFSHTFHALVEPAAGAAGDRSGTGPLEVGTDHEDELVWQRRREFAAFALDHAARDPGVAGVTVRKLRQWRRTGDVAQRWTAAVAWGLDIGHRDLATAMDELRIIGTPDERAFGMEDSTEDEWGLIWIAGQSLTKLFATGAHNQVLAQLREWLGQRRESLYRLVVQSVLLMAALRVSGISQAGSISADEILLVGEQLGPRGRWPVLLALPESQPELAEPAAALLRAALRSPWSRAVADRLGSWLRLAQHDDDALAAVEAIVPRLVRQRSDAARLRTLVRRRAAAWEDPLDPGVAERLCRLIDGLDGPTAPRKVALA
jgi:hypothetical protein